jgi:hypothetical protein
MPRKQPDRHVALDLFPGISSVVLAARRTERYAHEVLPEAALMSAAARTPSAPLALATTPVLLEREEAEVLHLNAAITHRPWHTHGPGNRPPRPRRAPNARRHHPNQPVEVLLIPADAVPTREVQRVIEYGFQVIEPAATAVPGHDWRAVVERLATDRSLAAEIAMVVFNDVAETLTPGQIRALLNDRVAADTLERAYHQAKRKAQAPVTAAPGDAGPSAAAPAPADDAHGEPDVPDTVDGPWAPPLEETEGSGDGAFDFDTDGPEGDAEAPAATDAALPAAGPAPAPPFDPSDEPDGPPDRDPLPDPDEIERMLEEVGFHYGRDGSGR